MRSFYLHRKVKCKMYRKVKHTVSRDFMIKRFFFGVVGTFKQLFSQPNRLHVTTLTNFILTLEW